MITFLVPTYNEKENIYLFINTIRKLNLDYEYNILFVDDDSIDGTKNKLLSAKGEFDNINYIVRFKKKRDLTQSLVLGIDIIKDKYTIILDCDLQHEVIKIPELIETIVKEKLDIVIGSRFIKNSQNIEMSNKRILESRIAIMICHLLGIREIKDPLSGFFIIETKLLKNIKEKINTRGFKILFTILYLYKNKISTKEIPIKFNKRIHGKTKLNLRIKLLFLEQILKLLIKKVLFDK
tara:strand:- start:1528 stop:2238 length:711 start_codon:yes stop_codon:yes gene_type:complete